MGESMHDMRVIVDLQSYLEAVPGIHPIVTGTFDPPHIQHTAPVVISLEELAAEGITNPYIVLPHNKNKRKTPTATLSERRRWMLDTFDFFARDIAHRVKICVDMSEPNDRHIYDLPEALQERLLRIAGRDKDGEIQKGKVRTKFVDRGIDMSSSRIRELMKMTKSHPVIKEALAPKVWEEVVARGYYI